MDGSVTRAPQSTGPRSLALPGTHERVVGIARELSPAGPSVKVLDIGAGEGALSARLKTCGYEVYACDLYPDAFRVPNVECRPMRDDSRIPYDETRFDLVIAVELVEHIESHEMLFREVRRVLKPSGRFICTTPNILSLKSRLQFLLTGYFYSFGTLDPQRRDPVSQHISPFTLDRYAWLMAQTGLRIDEVRTDKYQRSSLALGLLAPLVRYAARRAQGDAPSVRRQNADQVLFGRKLILIACPAPESS